MSVPSELKASSRRFMEQLLLSRPADPISFAMQYFFDERCTTPSVNHAIHSLTFLIRKPVEFRSSVATIYCAETVVSDSSTDDGKSKGSAGASSSAGSGSSQPTGEKDEKDDTGAAKTASESKSSGDGEPSSSSSSSSSSTKAIVKEESLSGSVDREENLSSVYLHRLCKIARMAIAASDGSLAIASSKDNDSRNFSPSLSMNVPGTETTEWIYNAIEKFMQGDPISQAVSLNFETYISFLRLYLSLWASLDWLCKGAEVLIESTMEGGSSVDTHSIFEPNGSDLKLSEPTLMPDDIDILGRSLKGTFMSCSPEEKANLQVVVSRSFDTFAKSLLSDGTASD